MAKKDAVKIIGLAEFAHFLDSLSGKLHDPDGCTENIAAYMESSTKRKLQNGLIRGPKTGAFTLSLRRGSGGGISLVDNAGLIQSIEHTQNAVGSNLIYAPIHNTGGTIRAKKATYLAIPATKEAKKLSAIKGVRGTVAYLKRKGYSVWVYNKKILGKKSKKGNTFVLFYLKKEVKIPKQEFLYIDDTDETVIREVISSWLKS